ncbi:hypothetical protein [Pseudomarimonas salicorniae]|uniref:DUF4410 domain-containing protein n=1 Tax=Pseudomarimonas salicorniae TaxID=2933270 RepID=A0ABT0GCV5_9GAMM|nr:hypothetical protein [Lysobacter sp. CAU 1642]MCK7592369.1 hypothetical protein [Lysobacter sp. CAU 1642]
MKPMLKLLPFALALASAPALADSVRMAAETPYSEDAEISEKVRSECLKLNGQLPAYTREFGAEFGVRVDLLDRIDTAAEGRVLEVEILDAVSMGNAFIGHQKHSRIKGNLYENGQLVASFKGRRNSMGGAFAGYKGSCSVLGRTMKALGKDIAQWLQNPTDGARLGDM